jgi:ABC-type transporter Mla MlaB component
MKIHRKGRVTYLQGELTHRGVTLNIINSLSHSLQEITFGRENSLRIDCGGVYTADMSGLQLLYVWMQCARFRGVESELVNLPDGLQNTIQAMGLEHCFAGE